MAKFYRVFSDSFTGHVFTQAAYEVVKTQIGNGHPDFHEVKEISSVEIDPSEQIYDIADLPDLGYMTTKQEDGTDVALTEQSDDDFLGNVASEESFDDEKDLGLLWDFDESDDGNFNN